MHSVLEGLLEGWWMVFDTFWALVFGFAISGFVQALAGRTKMRSLLGDHSGKAVTRATFFGIVSSSCSYAASALAHSIFRKGADFTASMIFMFASTNLVIELGLVLWLLIGWQFAAAEFVGGTVMIALLSWITPRILPDNLVRDALSSHESAAEFAEDSENELSSEPKESSTHAKLSASSGYTIGDFIMLRWELIIGFLVAGLAMKVVPFSFWKSLFISGHGFWSALENAIIGPFLAIISFVCSVGNVPLAAALWSAGITFGGVIAFIFADLISMPLILIYRKYYGPKIALKMTLVFWFVMSLSGLVTQAIFSIAKKMPLNKSFHMNSHHVGWNATTILNVLALFASAGIYYFYKHPPKDGESDFAQDPICGMQVRKSDAPARFEKNGELFYFCMEGCKEKFATSVTDSGN